MLSKILTKNNIDYCSNCHMRQFNLKEHCFFCGNLFSNYESILIERENDKIRHIYNVDPVTGKIKEGDTNESNIH